MLALRGQQIQGNSTLDLKSNFFDLVLALWGQEIQGISTLGSNSHFFRPCACPPGATNPRIFHLGFKALFFDLVLPLRSAKNQRICRTLVQTVILSTLRLRSGGNKNPRNFDLGFKMSFFRPCACPPGQGIQGI